MSETDRERLVHMLDAAREAISFSGNRTRDDFDKDRMLLLAVIKDIEIVGEAARNVSTEQRFASADIPWSQVIGMRNQLTHGYFDWDVDLIWGVLQTGLPELIVQLESLLESK